MELKELIIRKYSDDPRFNQTEFAKEIGCSPRYVRMVLRDCKNSAA
ncbi:MAG: hypothetical protein HKO79_06015, partial [Desulfobacterales bacterium]|nr:hypothetical protein [Desulfobacterales bacterium]